MVAVIPVPWLIVWWVVNDFGPVVGIVPIAVGLWVHQLYDIVAEACEHERALDACRAALRESEDARARLGADKSVAGVETAARVEVPGGPGPIAPAM